MQIPSLSPVVDTVIYVYYANAAAADQQNRTGVWDSNYKGVWHLANGASLTGSDATSNAANGIINGATATIGQIDGGAGVNGNGIPSGTSIPLSAVTRIT